MGNFTDKDKGWNQLMSAFKVNAGETAGFVGWLRSSGEYQPKEKAKATHGDAAKPPTPITIAQIAAIHEFGAPEANIPERAPIRGMLAEHGKDIRRLIKKVAGACIDGKMNKKQAIGIVCQKMADGLVAKIESNLPPPNEPETVARKGSSKTLIDTGQMKNSVDWEIKGGNK